MKFFIRFCLIGFLVMQFLLAKAQPGYNFAFGNGSSSDAINTLNTGGYSIAKDPQGNVYITGGFVGTVNFNPTGTANLTAAGGSDIFVAKYSTTGVYQWAFAIGAGGSGTTANDATSKIIVDLKGNIYIAGISRAANGTNIDFDPSSNTNNLTMLGTNTNFVVKYDGNKIPSDLEFYTWGFVAGNGFYLTNNSNTMLVGNSIAVDKDGYVYLTGGYAGSCDMDPSNGTNVITATANTNMFTAKYNGNLLPSSTSFFQWVKNSTSDANGFGSVFAASAIAVDGSGNVYVTGAFNATNDGGFQTGAFVDFSGAGTAGASFSNVLNGTGNYSIFHSYVVKYNNTGSYQWAFTLANPDYQEINDIKADAFGNIYLTGQFGYYGNSPAGNYVSTQDFDPSANTNNLTDAGYGSIFIAKYNGTLNPTNTAFYQWAFKVSGSTTQYAFRGLGIDLDPAGNIYATGQFANSNIDFNPGVGTNTISSSGAQDAFVASYDNNGLYRWAYALGGTGKDAGKSIIIDVSGNILLTGYYNSAGYNPGFSAANLTGTGAHNILVQSLSQADNNFIKWVGSGSNAFAAAANWVGNAVPTATKMAVIPTGSGNNPVQVSSTTSLTDLSIQSGASIQLATANLTASNYVYNVAGTVTVGATYTLGGTNGIYNSGTINGAGTISGNILNISTGTIAPGSSSTIGKINQTGNLTTYNGGIINIKAAGSGGAGATNGHDQIAITGIASIGGTLNISTINGHALSGAYTILTATSITGTFSTVNWPAGVTNGIITYNSNSVVINVPTSPPTITSFTPLSAKPGDAVTITGTNFNTTTTNNIVFFGATRATVTAATATSLTVTVPIGATYASISVLNTGSSLSAASLKNFTPVFSPAKTSITTNDFSPKQDFQTVSGSFTLAIADLDGDGKSDIVASNLNSNSISIYRNTSTTGSIASNSFASKVDFTTGAGPWYLTINDLNGDGKPDIIVANINTSTISIFKNTSTSGVIDANSFSSKVDISVGTGPSSIAVGDIDGDGKPDLAVVNNTTIINTVSILRNLSTGNIDAGSFSARVTLSTGTLPSAVAMLDVDGDGKLDLAVTNQTSNSVSIYRNIATSGSISTNSFEPKVDFTTGSNPRYLAVGDLDGDGKPDLVVPNMNSNTVSIYRNTSSSGVINTNSFATKVDFITSSSPYLVAISDLNGDGKADLALSHTGSNVVSVFRNTNSGNTEISFNTKVDFTSTSGTRSVAIGDLDGDGKPDLATANSNSSFISVFRNIDIPTTSPPTITSFTPLSAKPGDPVTITGTNFNTTPTNNIVFFGATRATVTAATATSLTVTVPIGATYAPISVLNTGSSLSAASLKNFTPVFSPAKTSITIADFSPKHDFATGSGPYYVAISDLDGDGKADLVVPNYNSNTVSIYRNTSTSGNIGSGSFVAKQDFTTGSSPNSVAIGDLDGDGKPDLAVVNYSSSTVSVFRNTSSSGSISAGSFAAKQDFVTGSAPSSVAIGDLDGDGKPDLAVCNLGAATVSVFRNTSSNGSISAGSFAAKQDFATGTAPYDVAIGDIDGDGKPELVVSNRNSSTVSVFHNTSTRGSIGSGSFATKQDFAAGSLANSVAIGDLDGDGKPDLAVANRGANTVSVFHNTSTSGSIGSSSFATKQDFVTGSLANSVAIGDMDGDGKPDLVVANRSVNNVSVLRNTSTIGSLGSGSFATKQEFTSGSNPLSIAIGDIDGDGRPDLATANFSSASLSVIRNAEIPPPSITSATFDGSTGVLSVTGVSLTTFAGANNDIDVSKITLTGQGGSTYTLTTANVEITNATSFSVTLNATDRAALVSILNKNGLTAQSGTTYNLAAAANWLAASAGNADLTGNAITVSKIATITSSGTLTAINTNAGTASANTSFTISGEDMAAGILITPPAGFELSTSANGPFTSTLTVGASGAIATTTVYVRLAASTPAGTYSGNIVLSSSGAASVNIATISSTVTAVPLITSTNNFTSFTTCAGIVSTEQLFTVSGQFLTADLVITAPNGFEISQAVLGTGGAVIGSTGSYSNSITLTRTAENVPSTSLFIRLSTSAVSTTTAGNISCTTTGGTTVNIPIVATISTRPAAPSISAASSLSVCAGNSVALTSTLGSTGNTLAWFRNGVSINNTITTYTASIAGSYTTVETSSNGCASNASVAAVVVVNAVPEATITQGSQLAFNNCETASVNLNANTGSGLTYQWRLNEVDIAGATASTYAVKQAGNYTVRVSNSSNCSIESTVTNVVAVPSATVTGATNVCAGSTVSLTANTTGFANPTYQWLKDGAVINNATAANFGATQTGSYSVRITSGTIVSTSCPVSITVNPLPLVAIAAAPSNSVCVGTSAALSATSATAVSYQWFNGTSAIAAATGLSLAITESGTYNVKVSDANGCVSTSDASTIAVNALPTIAAISGANQVNIGSNISLFNTTSGGVWSTNNSAIATINASTGLLNAISAGSVKVLYTVQNANGCSSFVGTTILVNSIGLKPTISTSTATSFCAGSSVILTSSAATLNQWYKDGVVIGGANGVTYTATQTGVYTVAAGLNQVLSDGIQVTVNPLPIATIAQGAELAFTDCASSFINITANSLAGATYQWLNASGNILNATNQQYAVTEAGNYSVRITDANGCISTSSITKVAALPTASVTGSTIVCEGTPVSLSVDQFGYSSPTFQWKNAGVNVSGATSASFNPTVSGTYTVAVTDNAITSTSCPIAITVNPLPTGSIAASTITPVCVGTPITLTATPSNASTYQWFNAGNGITNATNNNYIANASGMYSVGITDANGCFNTIGSTTVTINAIPIVGDIVGEQNICVNTNANFTNPTTGGLWSSSNTAVATVDQFGLVRGVSSGTATISYTVTTNTCATTVTRTVTVIAGVSITTQPTASISQCVGTSASINVVATGNNLTYQWFKNGTVINGATTSSYGDNNLVASDAGNYTVVVSSTCGFVTSITSVWTVNAFPVVTLTGTQQVCIGSTTTFASPTTGGVWSSSNTSIATINAAGIITGLSAGAATISYTVTNASGCITTITRDITVNALPIVAAITGIQQVCSGNTVIFASTTTGGVWSSSNANVATVNAAGIITGMSGGTVTISYTVTNASGCITNVSRDLTVNQTVAVPSIGGPNAVCTGITDVFTNAEAGGVWTSSNTALATITSGGVLSAINGGVVNITYTVTTAAGCISSAAKQVILTATPAKPTITRDFSSNLVSSYNGTNRWFNVSNNLNINTSTSSYNPTTDGRYKVQGFNNGCIGEWSDEFVYTTSSIGTLYPNPANTYTIASIVSDKFQSVVLQLTDVTGKVLEEIPVTLSNGQNPIRINTTRLAKGVYMLVIKGTKLTYQQLIKE